MKKKLLFAILAFTAAFACVAGVTACKDGSGSDENAWGNVYTVKAAYAKATELGYSGTLEEFIESVSGKDGKNGTDGKDGVGITSTLINDKGELIIVLSNGVTQNLGKVMGNEGKNGENGMSAFEIYAKYHPEYGGTEQEWIESLKGKDGKDGENATGIDKAYVDADGNLILVLTNNEEVNCGKVRNDRPTESLQYAAVKEDGKIIGYEIIGLGNVSDMDIVIPSAYNGKPVLNINFISTSEKEQITSVVIAEGITSISDNAFSGCKNLKSVIIPDSVTSIGVCSFSGCGNIESILIPDSVISIGSSAFYGCSNIKSILIPDSVTSIGASAFSVCVNIESITVDKENPVYHSAGNCLIETESKTLISGCKNSIIPSDGSVTAIGDAAFTFVSTGLIIPVSIMSIGMRSLNYCSPITYEGNIEQWRAINKTILSNMPITVYFNDGSSIQTS